MFRNIVPLLPRKNGGEEGKAGRRVRKLMGGKARNWRTRFVEAARKESLVHRGRRDWCPPRYGSFSWQSLGIILNAIIHAGEGTPLTRRSAVLLTWNRWRWAEGRDVRPLPRASRPINRISNVLIRRGDIRFNDQPWWILRRKTRMIDFDKRYTHTLAKSRIRVKIMRQFCVLFKFIKRSIEIGSRSKDISSL